MKLFGIFVIISFHVNPLDNQIEIPSREFLEIFSIEVLIFRLLFVSVLLACGMVLGIDIMIPLGMYSGNVIVGLVYFCSIYGFRGFDRLS